MTNLKTILTLFAVSICLSACGNTLQGIGQDIERAGETLQDAAN